MAAKPSLNGLKVLVTRPESQARNLCDLIAADGGEPVAFPVIDIKALPVEQWNDVSLSKQAMLIFISRNAVIHFVANFHTTLRDEIQMVAVGSATATAMKECGLSVDIQAPSPAGSESLLAMAELQNVAGKEIVIIRGQGGRELLADTLTARGANIQYIEVYQRQLSSPNNDKIEQAKQADFSIVTSVASLENLCQLIDGDGLKYKRLIVISERIKQRALELGFQTISVANDASDNAIMQKVRDGAK
ncbi:MAG: uroporphyrinogen-III synthase [Piscirickettsiaceae bacterium]|nr:uroporphyrinogen-III synthase [Piscirickettsiaceae bacterium]